MSEKNMTIEDLAKIMESGFAKMATDVDEKIDSLAAMIEKNMATKEDVKHLADGLEIVKADIRDIKTILNPIPQTVTVHTEVLDDLGVRVNKLEDKVFAT